VRADAHISVSKTRVRNVNLRRHAAARYESGRCFAVATAIGSPRLWSYATGAALEGFDMGLAECNATDMPRLEAAYAGGRKRMHKRCEALLERMLPDSMLVGLLLGSTELHVVSVGTGRVYLHRDGQPQRLTPRDEHDKGLLGGVAARCSSPISPGDIVLAGSSTAFSVKAIAKLASVLAADPKTPASVLATLLTEPAGRADVGAAAVALRIK